MAIRGRSIVIALLAGLALCTLLWFSGGKTWLEQYLNRELVKPWVVFDPPRRPLPLEAEVSSAREGVTICNRGVVQWENVLVRIRTSYDDLENEWIGETSDVRPSACVDVPITSFYSPDWKKIPASPGIKITQVQILATISGRGYWKQGMGSGEVR